MAFSSDTSTIQSSQLKSTDHPFFYTFGSDEKFPFQNGYIVVWAPSIEVSNQIFQSVYPNRPDSDCLNCAFVYTKAEWDKGPGKIYKTSDKKAQLRMSYENTKIEIINYVPSKNYNNPYYTTGSISPKDIDIDIDKEDIER